ncbi:hypothetical protein G9A89_022447 [Geosiphon pyriformis]|nr:hypothetical protein G9A89_022447 [Geosiphon pyriformis]
MSLVLGDSLYFNMVHFLKIASVAYGDQLLDKNGSVTSTHLNSCLHVPSSASLASVCASVLDSTSFADICKEIHGLWADEIDVYTDSFLRGLDTFQVACGAATYFPSLNKGLGMEVYGVLSSILAELQAVALALKCVPASVSVALHTDNLTVRWIKVKGHAGIAGNVMADVFAEQAAHSRVSLSAKINCRYMVADGRPVSGNAHHFWKVGSGQEVLSCLFGLIIDWNTTTALHTYFMKAVHFKLPVAVRQRLYNKDYSGVSCLFCGNVELSDYGFTCSDILGDFGSLWKTLMDSDLLSPSFVLQDLSLGMSDVGLYSVFCKEFVLKSWMDEAIAFLSDKKKVAFVVVNFVHCLAKSHRINLWLFRIKFRFDMEKSSLIGDDVVVAGALGVGTLPLSAGTVRLIGVLDSLNVGFSFRNRFLFLSGAVYRISVSISV